MSSTKETYINIGTTCVSKIEDTFLKEIKTANMHKNKIIQLTQRVENLCNMIGKRKVTPLANRNAIEKLIQLNTDLYRVIFEEEPPNIRGHSLHVAIAMLERICILLVQNDCMTAFKIGPTISK